MERGAVARRISDGRHRLIGRFVTIPAVVLMVTCWSSEAFAVLGVGDVSTDPTANAFLAQQVSLLSSGLAEQVKEIASLGEIITTMTQLLKTSNEIAGAVRFTAEVYNALRHYSVDDLKRDALNGLHKAFPELADFESSLNLTEANVEAAERGPAGFFAMRNYQDKAIQQTLSEVATAELSATTYSQLFPKAFKDRSAAGVTEADRLVLGKFLRTGKLGRTAAEAAASASVRSRINALVEEAEGSKQRDQIVDVMSLEATQDSANNIRRMKELQEADVAEVEAGHRAIDAVNQQAQGDVSKAISEGALSRPGWNE
jgi:hypothetical protein